MDSPHTSPSPASTYSPSLSLASLSILPYTNWETHSTFGSDYLPILITLDSEIKVHPSENRTFTNVKRRIGTNLKRIQKKKKQTLTTVSSLRENIFQTL